MDDEYTIPAPEFLSGGSDLYCENTEELSQLYRHIMYCLTKREPRLHPSEFSKWLPEGYGDMDEHAQRLAARACSNMVFDLLKPLFEDELFMEFVAIRCDCGLDDIIRCIGAYYGDIAFGKIQLVKYMQKIVAGWSQETRETLGM